MTTERDSFSVVMVGESRPSTSSIREGKTWMAGPSPAMTGVSAHDGAEVNYHAAA